MKKTKIAALIMAACLAASVVGCGSKEISNDYITISQYKNVEVEKVDIPEITDEQVEAQIDSQLSGETKDVTDRELREGDIAQFDYEGKLNGETFDKGTLTLGNGEQYVEGFVEGIIGHQLNETFEVPVTFPEGYGGAEKPELSGADVVFTVTITSIKEKVNAELTDDFVKKVSDKSKTVKEYKEEVKEMLNEDRQAQIDETLQDSAWSEIMKNIEVKKYPEDRLKETEEDVINRMSQMMEMYYGVTFDEYLEQSGVTEEDFKKQVTASSKEYLKQMLAMELIAEKEGLTPSEKEYEEIMKEYADMNGFTSVEEMTAQVGEKQVKEIILQDKVREWAGENCKQVEKKEEAKQEEQKPAEESKEETEEK